MFASVEAWNRYHPRPLLAADSELCGENRVFLCLPAGGRKRPGGVSQPSRMQVDRGTFRSAQAAAFAGGHGSLFPEKKASATYHEQISPLARSFYPSKSPSLWHRREEGRREMRRCLGSTFEQLEPRMAMTISSPLPIARRDRTSIRCCTIDLDGQQVVIPAGVGSIARAVQPAHARFHGHAAHWRRAGRRGPAARFNTTLQRLFDVWRSSALRAGAARIPTPYSIQRAEARLARIMDQTVDASTCCGCRSRRPGMRPPSWNTTAARRPTTSRTRKNMCRATATRSSSATRRSRRVVDTRRSTRSPAKRPRRHADAGWGSMASIRPADR